MSKLPWRCSEHPNAQIRHSWDEKHYVLNSYPAGAGIKSNINLSVLCVDEN